MQETTSDSDIAAMDIFQAKQLREKLSKRITKIRKKDSTRLETIISAEKKQAMDIAINWTFEKNIIKNKTRYAFLKFAVESTIKLIIDQMERDENEARRQVAINSQQQPIQPEQRNPYNAVQQGVP